MQLFQIAVGLVLAVNAAAAVRPLDSALQSLNSGDQHRAYKILESVSASDDDFSAAATELQKLHYRHQDWRKFFAYAQFYRLKYLQVNPERTIEARLIALEVMALAKHCLWDNADNVLAWALQQKRRLRAEDYAELQNTRDYLDLQRRFPGASNIAKEDRRKSPLAFSSEQVWRIEAKAMVSIAHPKLLSVQVKSQCR